MKNYDPKQVERAGRLLLSFSNVPPADTKQVEEFLKAVEHSTIPDAAGDIGYAITGVPPGGDEEES